MQKTIEEKNKNPIRVTDEAREALKELASKYPREISLKEITSQAIIEKRDREIQK